MLGPSRLLLLSVISFPALAVNPPLETKSNVTITQASIVDTSCASGSFVAGIKNTSAASSSFHATLIISESGGQGSGGQDCGAVLCRAHPNSGGAENQLRRIR